MSYIGYKSQPLDFNVYSDGVSVNSVIQKYALAPEEKDESGQLTGQPVKNLPDPVTGEEWNIKWTTSPPAYVDYPEIKDAAGNVIATITSADKNVYWEMQETHYSDDTVEEGTPSKSTTLDVDFINALGITAKKITVLQNNTEAESTENRIIFEADGFDATGTVKIGGFTVTPSELATRTDLGNPNLVLYNQGSTTSEPVEFLPGEVTPLSGTSTDESDKDPLFSCFSNDASAENGGSRWENFRAIRFTKTALQSAGAEVYWAWLQVNRSISDTFTIYLSHCGHANEDLAAPDYLMAFNPVYADKDTSETAAINHLQSLMMESFIFTDTDSNGDSQTVGEFDQVSGALVTYTDEDGNTLAEPLPITDKSDHLITIRDRTTAVNDGQYKDRCTKITYTGLHKPDNYLMFIPVAFVVRNIKIEPSTTPDDNYTQDDSNSTIATIYIPNSGYNAVKAVEIGEKFKVSTVGQLVTTDPILGGAVSIPEKATIGAFEISDTFTNNALTLNHQGIRLMPEAKLRFMGADETQSKLMLESAQKEDGVTDTAINSLSSNYSPLAVGYNVDKANVNSSLAAITFDATSDDSVKISADVEITGKVDSENSRNITVKVTPKVSDEKTGDLLSMVPDFIKSKSFIVSVVVHYSYLVTKTNSSIYTTIVATTDDERFAPVLRPGTITTVETGIKFCRVTFTTDELTYDTVNKRWNAKQGTVNLPGGYTFTGASTSISNNNAGTLSTDKESRTVELTDIAQTTYKQSPKGSITLTADTTVIGNITAGERVTKTVDEEEITEFVETFSVKDGQVFADSFYASSDRRLKQNISALAEKQSQYNLLFDGLNPVEFKFKADPEKRLHLGFIAQETDAAAKKLDANLALVDTRNTDHYSLNYLEIIALNTLQIKQLKAQVAELTKQLAEQTKTKS